MAKAKTVSKYFVVSGVGDATVLHKATDDDAAAYAAKVANHGSEVVRTQVAHGFDKPPKVRKPHRAEDEDDGG